MATFDLPLLVYALLLALAVPLPFFAKGQQSASRLDPRWLAILVTGIAIILTFLRGGLEVMGAVLLVLSSLGYGLRSLAGTLAAALLFAATIWWFGESPIPASQHWLAAGACLVLAVLARRCRFEPLLTGPPSRMAARDLAISGLLLIAGLGAGLLTGALNAQGPATMAWHHWGAYVSPVLPLLAGGVPFRDFPVQYGMGPTLLIASACGIGNCWTGLYAVTMVANALYLAACGWSVTLLTRNMDRASRWLALAALACAVLLWCGFPVRWGSPLLTPSVGGLRFLPLAVLTVLILTTELRNVKPGVGPDPMPRSVALSGHAIWLLSLAWSPEAAFFATLVWWPWLALRRADAANTRTGQWLALLRGGLLGLAAVLTGFAALAVLFRALFGDWVPLEGFLLYFSYPPGRMPVYVLGAIWFAVAVMLLAITALARASTGSARRSLYACLLAALAVGTYYLSRSHDNNVLNLLPFLILLLLASHGALPGQFSGGFVRAALAGIVALTSAIAFHPWGVLPGSPSLLGLQLGPGALTSRFAPVPGQKVQLVTDDTARALADLREHTSEAVLLFDEQKVMAIADPAHTWTAVNNAANFAPLPDEVVRDYIRRSALVYHRPGWIVAADSEAVHWLGLFGAAYDVTEHRRYGTSSAWHLVPRRMKHE